MFGSVCEKKFREFDERFLVWLLEWIWLFFVLNYLNIGMVVLFELEEINVVDLGFLNDYVVGVIFV